MLDELECSMRTEGRGVAVWLTTVYIAFENTDVGC
jgi:hypothetical protein